MKKLIILIVIALFCTSLSSKTFFSHIIPNSISMSYNAVNVENGVKFYVFETEASNDNFYSRVKQTYTDSVTFKEHEYAFKVKYKFIQFRARWQKNDFVNLNVYQLDLRGAYKGWSAGCLQSWDNDPLTQFVFGKEFKFNINFLIPGTIETRSDFMTSNFSVWNYENILKLKFKTEIKIIENIINLLKKKEAENVTIPSSYLKAQYRIKDYGRIISEILFGVEVDF